MTQEEKDLLLKDLIARLPYGVKIALKNNGSYHHDNVAKKGDITTDRLKGFNGSYFSICHNNPLDWDWYDDDIDIEDIKPYLFQMSSMNEEQRNELHSLMIRDSYGILYHTIDSFDYLYKNHIDIRGLIEKGLAIDSTNKNIY